MGLPVFRAAGLAAVVVVGIGVSACSSSPAVPSKTAAQLVPQIQEAAYAATSVHVAGSVQQGKQTETIDVSIVGDSVAGYLGAYGTQFYVLSVGGESYIKVNAAFLDVERAPASMCAALCGKYVELADSGAIEIAELLSMPQLVKEVFSEKEMSSLAATGCIFAPTIRSGQSVLQCSQGGYMLDVAAQGPPYLVYWAGPHGQHLGFSNWNSVVLPPPPPASQVVSISDVGG
jgi:hypothetical protein